MNTKIPLLFLFLFTFPLVHADIGDTVKNVWQSVISVGSLQFLGVTPDTAVVAFTRILLVIFVFALLFGVLSGFGGSAGPLSFLSRGQAGIVAGIIAILTGIFLPPSVILAVGTEWATLVALLLLGTPILAMFFLLHSIPDDSCPWRFLKLIIALLLLWIIGAMQTHVLVLGGNALTPVVKAVQQFITWSWWITAFIALYYLIHLLGCGEKKPRKTPDWSPFWDWLKRKTKKDDDDKDDDEEEKEKKKKKPKKGPTRKVKKIGGALITVVDKINDVIKEIPKDPAEAKKLLKGAKTSMTKELTDSRVILELADGTPHLSEAQKIVGMLQIIRGKMNIDPPTEPELRKINADLGVAIKLIGELIKNVST